MATLTKAERREIRARTAMALDAASKLTKRWTLRKRVARLLLHLDSRALTTWELSALSCSGSGTERHDRHREAANDVLLDSQRSGSWHHSEDRPPNGREWLGLPLPGRPEASRCSTKTSGSGSPCGCATFTTRCMPTCRPRRRNRLQAAVLNFPDKIVHIIIAVQPRCQRVLGVVLIECIDIELHVSHGAVPREPVSFYFLFHKTFLARRHFTAMEIESRLRAANLFWWKLWHDFD